MLLAPCMLWPVPIVQKKDKWESGGKRVGDFPIGFSPLICVLTHPALPSPSTMQHQYHYISKESPKIGFQTAIEVEG